MHAAPIDSNSDSNCGSTQQGRAHFAGRVALKGGHHVAVEVQRRRNGRVTHRFLHHLRMNPACERDRRVCVTEVVQPNRWQTRAAQQGTEPLTDERASVNRCAGLRREYEVTFCPQGTRREPFRR